MYEVKDAASGNDFGHQESNMNHVVKGSYHVLLPDGRMQRVDYMADWQSGYNPTVTYTGEAMYGPGVGGGKANGGGGQAGGGAAGGGYVYRR